MKACTYFSCLPELHDLDIYVKSVGVPLRAVQFPHPYLGRSVHSRRFMICLPEATGDYKGAWNNTLTTTDSPQGVQRLLDQTLI